LKVPKKRQADARQDKRRQDRRIQRVVGDLGSWEL